MVIQRDYYASLVFIFTGILTSFFSKNMIVILSISLVVSYLLKNNANLEGFEEGIVDTAESSNASEINEAYLEEDTNNAENEHAENEQARKLRNEKIFNTGAIFDMVNPELLLRKNTKTNPYGVTENKTYRQLVGLIVSYNKIVAENNQDKLQQLESLGSSFLNDKE